MEKLILVGNAGAVHVGAHLYEGAKKLGLEVRFCNTQDAFGGPSWLRRLNWRLRGRRPTRLIPFSEKVVETCRQYRPKWILSTGMAPIEEHALMEIGKLGVKRLNYSTDDPWNPALRAPWFLRALPRYDRVFSPRRINIKAFLHHGCPEVSYLPFAYAPEVHFREPADAEHGPDVIFVGGADADRIPSMAALIRVGLKVALYGGYWDRYPETRGSYHGHAQPQALRRIVAGAKVALCLVRRANRDGHVMRTFEIPAIGACMLTEDTEEHREILGPEGEAVVYFRSIPEMLEKARWLVDHKEERYRLAATAHERIVRGLNTYQDRLRSMLA
jgi:hypothetical protein